MASSEWTDEQLRERCRESRRGRGRRRRRDGARPAARAAHLRLAATTARPRPSTGWPRRCGGRDRAAALLPRHPAGAVRRRDRGPRSGSGCTSDARVVVEKPFGRDLGVGPRAQRVPAPGLPRGAGLPHRPLPREGVGREPARVPLRQLAARAGLEPQLHHERADHDGRGASASRAAASSTRRSARSATSCRTTCCRSSPCWRWSRRSRPTPTRCATRRRGCSARSARSTRADVGAGPVPRLRRRGGRRAGLRRRDLRRHALRDRLVALGGRAVADPHRQVRSATTATEAVVALHRRRPACCSPTTGTAAPHPNELRFRLGSDDGVTLHLQAKAPGDQLVTQPIDLDVVLRPRPSGHREEAYQRLLEDAIEGDRRRFGRADSLDEQWRIVAAVLDRPARDAPLRARARGARPRPTPWPRTSAAGATRSPTRPRIEPDDAAVLAAIPYTRSPTIVTIGPLRAPHLRAHGRPRRARRRRWFAGRYGERFGVPREETYRLATRLVVAGVIGARLTWDIANWDQIDDPIDLIAVWEGGLQFAGGFIARHRSSAARRSGSWPRLQQWRMARRRARSALDDRRRLRPHRLLPRWASTSDRPGAPAGSRCMVRYEGGDVREPTLGDQPARRGHDVPPHRLYELLDLVVLFVVLWLAARAPAAGSRPGTGHRRSSASATAPQRFLLDFLRVNDDARARAHRRAVRLHASRSPSGVWILVCWRPAQRRSWLAEEAEAARRASAPRRSTRSGGPGRAADRGQSGRRFTIAATAW